MYSRPVAGVRKVGGSSPPEFWKLKNNKCAKEYSDFFTTGDPILNHLMILYVHKIKPVHKDKTDAINLANVVYNFVGEKANRKQVFHLENFQRTISSL